ncbi:MAG: thioredoxin family protein [Pseudomonadota bacterium]
MTGIRSAAAACALALMAFVTLGEARAAELLMFESADCVWCARWDRDIGGTYDRTAEGRIAPLRRLQVRGARPPGLVLKSPVVGTPTFVLVEADREVGRIIGYPGQSAFWTQLDALLDKLPENTRPKPSAPYEGLVRTGL